MLAAGLKQLEHATLGTRRVVHQFEQRQIAQPGAAVKVALRKNTAVLHHEIRSTSGLNSQNPLDSAHTWLAKKNGEWFE